MVKRVITFVITLAACSPTPAPYCSDLYLACEHQAWRSGDDLDVWEAVSMCSYDYGACNNARLAATSTSGCGEACSIAAVVSACEWGCRR